METGQKLPNGALVICEKNGVVLAVTRYYPTFITCLWDGENKRATCGNYFQSIGDAAADFESRVAANEG